LDEKTVKTVDVLLPRSSTLLKQGVNEKRGIFPHFFTQRVLQERGGPIRAKFGDIWCRKIRRRMSSVEGRGKTIMEEQPGNL
jgi:hypothetical protein